MLGFKITRVREIGFAHFRGFVGEMTDTEINGKASELIDTDADIVVLTGPNGYGKSSFLEGLLLFLTGWHYSNLDTIISLSHPGFVIQGTVATDIENEAERTIVWVSSDRTESDASLKRPDNFPAPIKIRDNELNARLCGFFQDKVKALFDDGASGVTLRDVFEPISINVQKANESLTAKIKTIEEEIEKLNGEWRGDSIEILTSGFIDSWKKYMEVFSRTQIESVLVLNNLNVLSDDDVKNAVESVLDEQSITERSSSKLIEKFHEVNTEKIEKIMSQEDTKAGGGHLKTDTASIKILRDKKRVIEIKIEEINRNYPRLEQDVELFESSVARTQDGGRTPNLIDILSGLSKDAKRWLNIISGSYSSRFERIVEELAAFDEIETEKCRLTLAAWLEPRIESRRTKIKLIVEKGKIEKELEKLLRSKRIRELEGIRKELNGIAEILKEDWRNCLRYREWEKGRENRLRSIDLLEKAKSFVKDYLKKYAELTSPDKELLEQVRKMANQVIARFSIVDGFLPLQLIPYPEDYSNKYEIRADNGRKLDHFSTGQLSQAAVAYLTAQNQSISHLLNHRVVILDDVTTSYDLSNLTREAILWRQLAYIDDDKVNRQKRQVFISSHHEDLTNHLLELLVPPEGKKMRLIRFVDWNPKTGPKLESFDVIPTDSVGDNKKPTDSRKAFAVDLEELRWQLN